MHLPPSGSSGLKNCRDVPVLAQTSTPRHPWQSQHFQRLLLRITTQCHTPSDIYVHYVLNPMNSLSCFQPEMSSGAHGHAAIANVHGDVHRRTGRSVQSTRQLLHAHCILLDHNHCSLSAMVMSPPKDPEIPTIMKRSVPTSCKTGSAPPTGPYHLCLYMTLSDLRLQHTYASFVSITEPDSRCRKRWIPSVADT